MRSNTAKAGRSRGTEAQLAHALRELLFHPKGFLVREQALQALAAAERVK